MTHTKYNCGMWHIVRNYCGVTQDVILRVTKSEFSQTIYCVSSLSGVTYRNQSSIVPNPM